MAVGWCDHPTRGGSPPDGCCPAKTSGSHGKAFGRKCDLTPICSELDSEVCAMKIYQQSQNLVPLISILVGIVIFLILLVCALDDKFDFRAFFIGFIVFLTLTIINLRRLILKKGNRFVSGITVLLCMAATIFIGIGLIGQAGS